MGTGNTPVPISFALSHCLASRHLPYVHQFLYATWLRSLIRVRELRLRV